MKKMLKKTITVISLLVALNVSAAGTLKITQDDILYIYDGDTYYIKCVEGLVCRNKHKIGVRDLIIDTPELKSPKCAHEKQIALSAKQRAVEFLRAGDELILEYGSRKYDKYGRLLARTKINNRYLDEYMLQRPDLTRVYKLMQKNWCP